MLGKLSIILGQSPRYIVIYCYTCSSSLAKFYQALLLAIPTELERFYQDFNGKTLLLVIPTELERFYQDFTKKALLLIVSI